MMMILWLVVMVLIVTLDQLSKYLTVLYLKPIGTFPIIRDVLHLTYVENRGAAFGMLANNRWVFMIISSVAIVAILIYMFKTKPKSRIECLSLSFIIAGGIGNMIDRTVLGYVVDMIDFRVINFAVFNVADSFVCVGAGMLMVWLIIAAVKEAKAEKAAKAAAAELADQDLNGQNQDAPAEDTPTEDTPAETPAPTEDTPDAPGTRDGE